MNFGSLLHIYSNIIVCNEVQMFITYIWWFFLIHSHRIAVKFIIDNLSLYVYVKLIPYHVFFSSFIDFVNI